MSGRWIQNPRNGVARIEPRLAMVDPFDRFLFIMPVIFTAFGFFLVGAMPVQVLVGVVLSCLAGDVLIWLRYALSARIHPPAKVTPLATLRAR